MKRSIPILAALCGLLLSLAAGFSQGTAFTYQGLLTENGNPATGSYDLRFNLYATDTDPTKVTTGLTNPAVAISNGLFTTTIDFGAVFTGARYWLDIGSRPAGSVSDFTPLTPRQELTPVPYALFAATAGLAKSLAGQIAGPMIADGTAVRSLNGLTDVVHLSAGTNVSITPTGNNLQISASSITLPFTANGASPTPLFSVNNAGSGSGLAGVGADKGVYGSTSSAGPTHAGVFGENSAAGGTAVIGNALNINSAGVAGVADAAGSTGVYARGTTYGAFGISDAGRGVYGVSGSQDRTTSAGVWGENPNGGAGVVGTSAGGVGVGGVGVMGKAANIFGAGVYGEGAAGAIAVYGVNTGGGTAGLFDGNVDVTGDMGITGSLNVKGSGSFSGNHFFGGTTRQMLNLYNTAYGIGVQNFTLYQRTDAGFAWYQGGTHSDTQNDPGTGGTTLMALSASGNLQVNATGGNSAVWGDNPNANGTKGTSRTGHGVHGFSDSGIGVYGGSSGGYGVYGECYGGDGLIGIGHNGNGAGVFGVAVDGAEVAAVFEGSVLVTTDLNVLGSKNFRIDHPLDPANKYLLHSCVESPDAKNIYDGNITTDSSGAATVILPNYFEALNGDFRYQLTVIGQFAQAIVSRKIQGNQFAIRTDKPNVEVSWQVTGIRQDAYMKAHPMVVEQEKPELERGTYQHPELFGQAEEQGLAWSKNPALWKRLKAERTKPSPVTKPRS